jgi:predicted aldo/keto reductase-like oxidoreductase
MPITRREVLKSAGAVAVGSSVPALISAALLPAEMPKRTLGKTGWRASIYALGSAEMPAESIAVRAVNELIDGGVNYLDTAPSYMGTQSERILGQVVKSRRKEVFLATKTLARNADGAYAEIQGSLERLQTRQIDTLQIHAVNDFGTLELVLGKNGAVKGLERARNEGLIRFIGITGHTRPEVIAKALDEYPFDSILVPVSAVDASLSDFATDVLPKANKLGIAVVGMKALKGMERATGGKFDAAELLRYAWTLPISTLTIGLRQASEVRPNLTAAAGFKKMSASDMRALERRVSQHADVGNLWWKRR